MTCSQESGRLNGKLKRLITVYLSMADQYHTQWFLTAQTGQERESERGQIRKRECVCVRVCDRGREADKRSHQQKHSLAVH